MSKKNQEVAIVDEVALAQLREQFPVEQSFQRVNLPRLGMFSQDKTEGKGKSMQVVAEAGVFYIERESDEVDENGKKVWKKEELGTEIEGTVVFYRKQLSMYDQSTEKYTNSPIYDNDDEVVPLFCERKEIARGLPKHLKAAYAYEDNGKQKSKLQENRVLHVLCNGEIYQMSLKGTSMYSFLTYARKSVPPTCLTRFSSEPQKNGATEWNMMTFTTVRPLDGEEINVMLGHQNNIKDAIKAEKEYFASVNQQKSASTTEHDEFVKSLQDGQQF